MSNLLDEINENDIFYILNNPWKFTNYEWKLHNIHNKKSSLDYLIERLELTRQGGYSKIWKTKNNLPLAILGAFKTDDTTLEGFFVASSHMEEDGNALKVTFDMREVIKEQSHNYKGCTLGLYSESKHIENQMSWLRLIGFKYKSEGNRGSTRYFEHVSKV